MASITAVHENTGVTSSAEPPAKAPTNPTMSPMTPPMRLITTASTRNWTTMSRRVAPTARRTPISRVRSRTVTSITLATPMPPTTRLMAAMAAISLVRVLVLDETADEMELASTISKSFWSLVARPCCVRSVASTAVSSESFGAGLRLHADGGDVGVERHQATLDGRERHDDRGVHRAEAQAALRGEHARPRGSARRRR